MLVPMTRAGLSSAGWSTDGPRVVVAHDYLTQRGGAERVVLALLKTFPNARVVTSIYNPETTFPEFADHDITTLWPSRFEAFRADPRRALPVLARAVRNHRIDDADVVVASSSGWAHGLGGDAPKVVYCHNPARWLYQPDDYAAGIGPHARLALRALAPGLKRWDMAAAHTCAKYVANSTVVQQRIKDAYGIDAGVLHPPPGLEANGPQEPVPGLEPGFLVTVSRARGYKNTQVVCEAVAGMDDARLVVVGRLPEGGWPAHLTSVTDLSDAQLRWVYANAAGLVAMSHEDFGLTPVEGYSLGLPSVLLRAGGYLDSSVEDITTVFVDDLDPVAVRAGIEDLLSREWDRDAILAHAEKFSLESFQYSLRRLVDEVLARTTVRTLSYDARKAAQGFLARPAV